MVRRLVAAGPAVSFLIPENVVEDVASRVLAWAPLADPGAQLHSCIYQRTGYTTSVAMGLFLEALESAFKDVRRQFGH